MSNLWRISEIQNAVEIALDQTAYNGQTSGRIRVVPDTRSIRYYTTIGMLDRAAEMRGRTAFYNRRHIMQLVAIKRLQAAGKSLVEIQAELAGATNRKLTSIAKLPEAYWETLDKKLTSATKNNSKSSTHAKRGTRKGKTTRAVSDVSPNEKSKKAQIHNVTSTEHDPEKQSSKTADAVEREFWKESVSVQVDENSNLNLRQETRIELPSGMSITIPVASGIGLSQDSLGEIAQTLQLLERQVQELLKNRDP